MGKGNRNKKRKLKDIKKPADDKSKTEDISGNSKTNVKVNAKAVTNESQRIAEEIQTKENMLRSVTKLKDDKEEKTESAEDTTVAEQSSHRPKVFMSDEEIKEKIDAIEKTVSFYQFFIEMLIDRSAAQNPDSSNSIFERYPDLYQILKTRHQEFFVNNVISIKLSEENIKRLWNIFYSSRDKSKRDKTSESYQVLRELKMVRHVEINKEQEVSIKNRTQIENDFCSRNILKSRELPQNTTGEKCKKEGDTSVGNIQVTETSSHIKKFESNYEILDYMNEKEEKEKDDSKMEHTKEMANLCTRRSKPDEISKQDTRHNINKYNRLNPPTSDKDLETCQNFKSSLNLQGMQELYFEEEIKKGDEALEEKKPSKEQADKANDIIKEFKKFKDHEEREQRDGYTDYYKMDGSLNEIEEKNERKKWNVSSGKEPIEEVSKSKYHNRTASIANEKIKELILAKKDDDPNEVPRKLNRNENIYFQFETDGMQINAGGKRYSYSLEEKKVVAFDYSDENVQVFFTGNQILVKTPSSEFDFSIRKSDLSNLASETTQTETLL